MIKRLLGTLLAVIILFSFSSTALASEIEETAPPENSSPDIEIEDTTSITTIDELLLGIENAADGDILYLSATIYIYDGVVIGSEEKTVQLTRSADFTGTMFETDISMICSL